ncbi:hypothetical protein I312_102928 [Cryptococcus bacillisporus CA1280]|uniref:Uncharacterized protein n=1 Tax=Cryptococcus bacillisporus CA1280 TaxID=1296109 RepID=A0A0D0VVW4_CRYGA|nr:hypothetical protein I312_00540 [Cryptococcus bacillisporus CA1280]
MRQLSDLELVAQAMEPSDKPPESTSKPNCTSPKEPSNSNEPPSLTNLPEGIDASTLTTEDLVSLHPLLSSLSLSPDELEGLDEFQMGEILAQMEAADGVADDLEAKLDRLLETLGGVLGGVEEEIVQEQEQEDRVEGEGNELRGGLIEEGEEDASIGDED